MPSQASPTETHASGSTAPVEPPTPESCRTAPPPDADPDPCPRSLLIGCCLASGCVGIEYGIIYPTIYPYLDGLGPKAPLMMGLASACFSVFKSAGFIPAGAWADKVGSRWPCVLLFLLSSCGNLYYYAARRPADVVAARAVVGLGSCVTGILMGVVATGPGRTAEQRQARDRNLALFNGTALCALLLGPGLAALFARAPTPPDKWGPGWCEFDQYDGPGLFQAALTACCAAWAAVALPAEPFAKGDAAVALRARSTDDDAVAVPPKPTRHHTRAALVSRRGASTLVVSFVGGALIASLDTSFPVVARKDFHATVTTTSFVLACFAVGGLVALVVAGVYAKRGPDDQAAKRKIRVVRFGTACEVAGSVAGLMAFRGLDHAQLVVVGLLVAAVIVFGAMFASNANVQLLAGVSDMRRHPGFYSGLRSVFVCSGRAVGGLMSGILLDSESSLPSDEAKAHTPIFAFVAAVSTFGLVAFACAPPRVVEDLPGELDAPLLSEPPPSPPTSPDLSASPRNHPEP